MNDKFQWIRKDGKLIDVESGKLINEEGKDYHKAVIRMRYFDGHKSPLEIVSYVKGDYIKFILKIDRYVKKASI